MNILVTGSKGQLGKSIQRLAGGSEKKFIFTDVSELDITDSSAVDDFIKAHEIDAVINCAAYTNVDKAEEEEELAYKINAIGPENLAKTIKERNGWVLHISSDYVFGGAGINVPCSEDIEVNPTGAYGRTKLEGEKLIEKSGCDFIIIRTAWLYSEYGKNFMKTIMNLSQSRNELKVVFDQCGTPTYAGDLASAILDIVAKAKFPRDKGIYHYSNEGVASWFDFATEICRSTNVGTKVLPCRTSEFPSKVMRPPYSVLDKAKIKRHFNLTVPHWRESLQRCMDGMK